MADDHTEILETLFF